MITGAKMSGLLTGKDDDNVQKYNRDEFTRTFGEKVARCFDLHSHPGHSWYNDRSDLPGGGLDQWWWCDGIIVAKRNRPGRFCGQAAPHQRHNWEREDGQDFLCNGEISIQENG